jgi:hypothetical protein
MCCHLSAVELSDNFLKGLWKDAACDDVSNVIADDHDSDDDDSDDDDNYTVKASSTTTPALITSDIPSIQ